MLITNRRKIQEDYFAELLQAVFVGMPDGERVVVIIYSYFDDSATRDESLITVGGAIQLPLGWIQLSYRWQKLMDEWDLPFFHMTDFEAQYPPYDWEPEVRHERLNKLLDLIAHYELTLFSCSVPRAWFKESASAAALQQWGSEYGLAAQSCFATVTNRDRRALDAKDATIAYFFERGIAHWQEIERSFKINAERPEARLNSIHRVPKHTVPPQVADLIVYEGNKEMLRILEMPGAPPKKRYPMERLERSAFIHVHTPKKLIRQMSDSIDRGMAEAHAELIRTGGKRAVTIRHKLRASDFDDEEEKESGQ